MYLVSKFSGILCIVYDCFTEKSLKYSEEFSEQSNVPKRKELHPKQTANITKKSNMKKVVATRMTRQNALTLRKNPPKISTGDEK